MYKRENRITRLILQLSLIVMFAATIFLFWSGRTDYAFVLLFLIVCGSIFPTTSILLTSEELTITQYYFYAFIKRQTHFKKGEAIDIHEFDIEVYDEGHPSHNDWWALFPTSRVIAKKYVLKRTDFLGDRIQIKLKLSEKEKELIDNWLHGAKTIER